MRRQRVGQQLHDREGGDRFAGAALADQSHRLSLGDLEADVPQGLDGAAGHTKAYPEIAHLQQRFHQSSPPAAGAGAAALSVAAVSALAGPVNSLRGSKASRTASPMKTSRSSMTAREKKTVRNSQGGVGFALTCFSSSPRDAKRAGSA